MYFIGVAALLVVPYLCGTFEMMVLRERNADHLKTYVVGLLSLFAYFLLAILVSLKLDLSFDGLRKIFLGAPALIGCFGLICFIVRIVKGDIQNNVSFNRDMLWFVPTAAVLGIVAFICMIPSFANDNTWEIVSTTLNTNTYYEYSSLTGNRIEVAHPIFTKIYVMPMFYSVMCKTFGFEMWFIAGLFMPVLFYLLNLCIMYSISGEIFGKSESRKRAIFMCAYLLFLLVGTYLPLTGITGTVGYALLREGYSGYALAYGVVLPFVLLLLLKKNYLTAALCSTAGLGLIPLDKFFFLVLGSPLNFWENLNYVGKLAAVYLVAVIALFVMRVVKGTKTNPVIILFPSVLVSYVIVKIGELVETRSRRLIYFVGVGLILLAACNFNPMEDGVFATNLRKENTELRNCLEEITKTESICLWSTDEIMSEARRLNSNTKLAYPRSEFVSTLNGVEYDEISDNVSYMRELMLNKTYGFDYILIDKEDKMIITDATDSGVDCIILSKEMLRGDFQILLEECGFERSEDCFGYVVFKNIPRIIK